MAEAKKVPTRSRMREQFEREFWDAHLSKLELPEEVLAKVLAWCKNPQCFLFLSSNAGVGKTYMTAAIANDWEEKNYPWRRFVESKLYSHLRRGIPEKIEWESELERLCDAPFFILDDLGTCRKDPEKMAFQIEVMGDFINMRWADRKPTIITSNLNIDQLAEYLQDETGRIISRLLDGRNTVIEMNGPDRRQNRNLQ